MKIDIIMLSLYTFVLYFVYYLAYIPALWNTKIKHWLKEQDRIIEKIPLKKNRNRLWVHCASLGEFEQVRPILERFRATDTPEIIVSFFSASGYEKLKNDPLIDNITYFPLDVPHRMQAFIERIEPDQVIFVKYEFWFNCLNILHQKQIPFYLVAGVFHSKQIFFIPVIGKYFIKYLHYFTFIFLQNQKSFLLAKHLNLKNRGVYGDPRCDRVLGTLKNPQAFSIIEHFKDADRQDANPILILGSSWQAEEDLVIQYLKVNLGQDKLIYKIIIAPHDVSKKHIQEIIQKLGNIKYTLYSTCDENTNFDNIPVLIIDSIGILSKIYRYADIAFIGGGFGKGLHNILEAAVFGIPIFFGPKIEKYQEALDLIDKGGAFIIEQYAQLALLLSLFENKEIREKAGVKARQYILDNVGAGERIYDCLNHE